MERRKTSKRQRRKKVPLWQGRSESPCGALNFPSSSRRVPFSTLLSASRSQTEEPRRISWRIRLSKHTGGEMMQSSPKQQAAGKTLSQSWSNHSTTKDKCCGIAIILCFTPGLSWASAVLCLSAHACSVTPYLILGLGGQILHSFL